MTHDAGDALRQARAALEAAGSPSAARDASALLNKVQADASPWTPLSEAQMAQLQHDIQRRARREPISHIIGRRAFWMHDFEVSSDVLDPRPETETLVDLARQIDAGTILDLGTGSGCILLSLLHEMPRAVGVGADVSQRALDVARRNAHVVGVADRVQWHVSDWYDAITGRFDLIVSNPPYIARDEMSALAPELAFEPRIALTDDADGLSAYRRIAQRAGDYLTPGGTLMVEIGPTQATAVMKFFEDCGLSDIAVHSDLDQRDLVVSGVFLP